MGKLKYLSQQPKALLTVLGFVLVLLVGVVDYLSTPQISISIFYLLPISVVTWFVGRKAGMVVAVASAATWLVANDLLWAVHYSHPAIPYFNAMVNLGIFLIIVFLVERLKSLNENLEQRAAALTQEIEEHKQAERKILHLNRLYATLSQINQAIVARGIGTLFSRRCAAWQLSMANSVWLGLA